MSNDIARITALAALPLLAVLALPAAHAQDSIRVFSPYRLVPANMPAPSLATTDLRLEGAADVADRHQVRFSSARGSLVNDDAFWSTGLAASLVPASTRLDPARATYRYTVLEQREWSWRVGVTTNLQEIGNLRVSNTSLERQRFGSLPLLHVAGDGRVAKGVLLGFDADGLMTPRGRAIELGLRVNYELAPNLALYGRYRLSESAGEAEEFYGTGLANSGTVGLRFRF